MEFNYHSLINNLEGFLMLLLLGAMVYCGVIWVMKRGGVWAWVFVSGSIGTFTAFAVMLIGVAIGIVTLATSSALTPDIPVTYETWELVGALAKFFFALSFLATGVALIFIGAEEGKRTARRRKKK